MEIIPAIDLRGGKCVRLYQGDYDRETVFSDNPLDAARDWVGQGASRLHVVDLDGARGGAPANLSVAADIASSVSVPVQLGGGIRTVYTARTVVSQGISRIMLGTAAVESPGMVSEICKALGDDAVVVSVDARDGYVAVKGWTSSSRVLARDLIAQMVGMGVRRFMYTDVARDGTLTEPNFDAIEMLLSQTDAKLIAAGGITSIDHLLRLAGLGVESAVVGTALYTGAIDLPEALEAVRKHSK